MKTLLAVTLSIAMAFGHLSVHACTAFTMSDGEKVLVGNNEDYNIPYTRVWFVPAENGRYGRVFFGYDNWHRQGGMNDRGLFFDFFATRPREVTLSKGKPTFKGPMIDMMLAQCSSVEQVLKMFARYNLVWMKKAQMFVVDKNGDAAIIEGDDIVRKSGSYQVVTNFHQSRVQENRRPCEWYKPGCRQYKTAASMLSQGGAASVALFRDILEATHRNTLYSKTLYSNIYDLKKGRIYLYYRHNFDNEVIIDLNAELKKGRHYYELPALFGQKKKFGRKVYTHPSPAFRISYPGHYKITSPVLGEVLLVKYPISASPQLGVYVHDKPQGIRLQDIGQRYFAGLVKKYSRRATLVASRPIVLGGGTPAIEMLFDRELKDHFPVKTMIVSACRGDKLVFAAVTTLSHPEALREFLHSLRFD